jgi:phosphoribosylformylglycinamidine (FGAM) synthase PurS component
MQNMTHTLFPKTLALVKDDGQPLELKVSQIRLADYDRALRCVNTENEFGLVALAAGVNEATIKSLSPESYEVLQAAVWEVNEHGFFTFARRRKNSQAEQTMIREMASQVLANPTLAARISATPLPSSPPKLG